MFMHQTPHFFHIMDENVYVPRILSASIQLPAKILHLSGPLGKLTVVSESSRFICTRPIRRPPRWDQAAFSLPTHRYRLPSRDAPCPNTLLLNHPFFVVQVYPHSRIPDRPVINTINYNVQRVLRWCCLARLHFVLSKAKQRSHQLPRDSVRSAWAEGKAARKFAPR